MAFENVVNSLKRASNTTEKALVRSFDLTKNAITKSFGMVGKTLMKSANLVGRGFGLVGKALDTTGKAVFGQTAYEAGKQTAKAALYDKIGFDLDDEDAETKDTTTETFTDTPSVQPAQGVTPAAYNYGMSAAAPTGFIGQRAPRSTGTGGKGISNLSKQELTVISNGLTDVLTALYRFKAVEKSGLEYEKAVVVARRMVSKELTGEESYQVPQVDTGPSAVDSAMAAQDLMLSYLPDFTKQIEQITKLFEKVDFNAIGQPSGTPSAGGGEGGGGLGAAVAGFAGGAATVATVGAVMAMNKEKESSGGKFLRVTNVSNAGTIGGAYGLGDAARKSAFRNMSAEEKAEFTRRTGFTRAPTLDELVTNEGKNSKFKSEQARLADELLAQAYTKQSIGSLQKRLGRAPTMADIRGAHWHGEAGYVALLEAARTNPNMTMKQFYDAHPGWGKVGMQQFMVKGRMITVSEQLARIAQQAGGTVQAAPVSGGTTGGAATSGQNIQQATGQAVSGFINPVQPSRITSQFGMRKHPIRGDNRLHTGIDYGVPSGTPVKASADGIVTFAGMRGAYGNLIIVSHANGMSTRYAHLSRIQTTLNKRVKQGQQIGAVGSTGGSTGPHLHFEVRKNDAPVNPKSYLSGLQGPSIPPDQAAAATEPGMAEGTPRDSRSGMAERSGSAAGPSRYSRLECECETEAMARAKEEAPAVVVTDSGGQQQQTGMLQIGTTPGAKPPSRTPANPSIMYRVYFGVNK